MFGLAFIPGVDYFELVFFLVENLKHIVACNVIAVCAAKPGKWRWAAIFFLPALICSLVGGVILGSWEDAARRGYDPKLGSMREAVEEYVAHGDVGGRPDINTILESNKYAPTFGKHEIMYLLKDLFKDTFLHLDKYNSDNIKEGYDKGNDWFEATLDPEVMVYTSGIYKTGKETLKEAQAYKLDYVADAIELKRGETLLDIGCGWGRLAKHMTDLGAKVTGVTLSKEQRAWALELNKGNGAKIELQDAMKLHTRKDLVPEGGWDKITSLEMAEHVGIKRYQEFLHSVHGLLKDDGVFYFQVAGLRRAWRYEDFVWGLFMGEHVFPGADASCPMGWVTSQLERGGFEVQRVSNLGYHYSLTLADWLKVKGRPPAAGPSPPAGRPARLSCALRSLPNRCRGGVHPHIIPDDPPALTETSLLFARCGTPRRTTSARSTRCRCGAAGRSSWPGRCAWPARARAPSS